MKPLPDSATYTLENAYMPWGRLIREICGTIAAECRQSSTVLDLMCGPGYLLNEIAKQRPDLHLTGVDIDTRYICYATGQNRSIQFIASDVTSWHTLDTYDVIVCTGGMHHLEFNQHRLLLERIAGLLRPKGTAYLADPYIRESCNEIGRRLAAHELGTNLLRTVIENNAPDSIVNATIGILGNDVLGDGEYKTTVPRIREMAETIFSSVAVTKTWPTDDPDTASYGDYYFTLQSPLTPTPSVKK